MAEHRYGGRCEFLREGTIKKIYSQWQELRVLADFLFEYGNVAKD